jgi:flagellar biosynthesis protein FlhF
MQTKAYFANSIKEALEVAREELGENALLVGSKPAPSQGRQFGPLEVTFAWDSKEAASSQFASGRMEAVPAGRSAPAGLPSMKSASPETDEIRRQLSALRVAVSRGDQPLDARAAHTATGDGSAAGQLVLGGFSPETAIEIASCATSRSGDPDAVVIDELTSRILTAPFVEMKPGEGRALAFIGPPGRGKTISLVKIAVGLGLARRVPVRIYCAGAHSPGGAQEQVARFAAILGTPFQACESLASLNLALNGHGWKGLALIDTPGISPADRNELIELKDFFAARPEIEKHLVLRADASSADMLHMISRFSGLTPSRLLFTGMDEAIRVTPVIEALIRGGIPATFAGTGQQIPEDLEELNANRLARAVWAGVRGSSGGSNAEFAQVTAA